MGKCVCSGIESCSSAYGAQLRVQCVFYELIKATLEAKQGEMKEGGKEDAGEARADERNKKEGISKKEMRRRQTERKGKQERRLYFCQQINRQAGPSVRQSVSQTEI